MRNGTEGARGRIFPDDTKLIRNPRYDAVGRSFDVLSHATARKSAEVSRRCLSWRLESFAGLTWPPALECYRRVPRQINFNVFVGVLTGREKALARYRRVPYRMESSRSTAQQQ